MTLGLVTSCGDDGTSETQFDIIGDLSVDRTVDIVGGNTLPVIVEFAPDRGVRHEMVAVLGAVTDGAETPFVELGRSNKVVLEPSDTNRVSVEIAVFADAYERAAQSDRIVIRTHVFLFSPGERTNLEVGVLDSSERTINNRIFVSTDTVNVSIDAGIEIVSGHKFPVTVTYDIDDDVAQRDLYVALGFNNANGDFVEIAGSGSGKIALIETSGSLEVMVYPYPNSDLRRVLEDGQLIIVASVFPEQVEPEMCEVLDLSRPLVSASVSLSNRVGSSDDLINSVVVKVDGVELAGAAGALPEFRIDSAPKVTVEVGYSVMKERRLAVLLGGVVKKESWTPREVGDSRVCGTTCRRFVPFSLLHNAIVNVGGNSPGEFASDRVNCNAEVCRFDLELTPEFAGDLDKTDDRDDSLVIRGDTDFSEKFFTVRLLPKDPTCAEAEQPFAETVVPVELTTTNDTVSVEIDPDTKIIPGQAFPVLVTHTLDEAAAQRDLIVTLGTVSERTAPFNLLGRSQTLDISSDGTTEVMVYVDPDFVDPRPQGNIYLNADLFVDEEVQMCEERRVAKPVAFARPKIVSSEFGFEHGSRGVLVSEEQAVVEAQDAITRVVVRLDGQQIQGDTKIIPMDGTRQVSVEVSYEVEAQMERELHLLLGGVVRKDSWVPHVSDECGNTCRRFVPLSLHTPVLVGGTEDTSQESVECNSKQKTCRFDLTLSSEVSDDPNQDGEVDDALTLTGAQSDYSDSFISVHLLSKTPTCEQIEQPLARKKIPVRLVPGMQE